jgi:Zn-dependent protease with chaperone function
MLPTTEKIVIEDNITLYITNDKRILDFVPYAKVCFVIATGLKDSETKEFLIDTQGNNIIFSKDTWDMMPPDVREFILLHEVGHIMHGHMAMQPVVIYSKEWIRREFDADNYAKQQLSLSLSKQ